MTSTATTITAHTPRRAHMAHTNISTVQKKWGSTCDSIVVGGHLLVVRNTTSSATRDQLRPVAVMVPPRWYNRAVADSPEPPHLERMPAAEARAIFGRTLGRVREADAEMADPTDREESSQYVHVVIAHKMQASHARVESTGSAGQVTSWRQPASNGVERAVLVGIHWYSHVTGIPVAAFASESGLREAFANVP